MKCFTETFNSKRRPDGLADKGCPLHLYALLAFTLLFLFACTPPENADKAGDSVSVESASLDADGNPITDGPEDGTAGTNSGSSSVNTGLIFAMPSPQSIILPGLVVTDFVVVSSRRTGRTSKEYVLKLKISNNSDDKYENVLATLQSAPQHITIIDAVAVVGDVPGNATIISKDSFTIDMDLAKSTSFDDFVWLIEGDQVAPPPPPQPGGHPAQAGFFMSIDNNAIPGESTSESHRDWIEIYSYRDGLYREGSATSGSTRTRSAFVLDGAVVSKLVDKASPKLRDAIAKGQIFTEVKIDIIKSCGATLYTAYAITLSIARVEELSMTAGGGDRGSETVAFDYTRIESAYTAVDRDCRLLNTVYSTQDGKLLDL